MLHLVYHKADVPSTRIRLKQMAPLLDMRGLACRLVANPRSDDERRAFSQEVRAGDVVLIHRVRPTRREARWWSTLPGVRLYDLDDAIMVGRKAGIAGLLQARKRRLAFRQMLRVCGGVVCGNAYLAALSEGGGRRVAVVPSPVPVDVPQHRPSDPASPFRIGWVGRGSNLRYVRDIAPALAEVARRRRVTVVVLSDETLELRDCPVENIAWSEDEEAQEVARFDAGIMPLDLEGPWARGKCSYKLLQYMAAGVPALGSRVGMNVELIRDGVNGLLAASQSEWVDALIRLIDDRDAAAKIAAAGRATACEDYSYEVVADRLAAFVTSFSTGNIAAR